MLFVFRGLGVITNVVVTVLAGRTLSVETMGQFNLIFSLSNILVIPLVMGVNNSLLKILPDAGEKERKEILGTVISGNIVLCLAMSLLGVLVSPLMCKLLHIPAASWYLAICFAIVTNSCILAETVLKANEKFIKLGIARVAGSLFLLGTYLVCVLMFHNISLYKFVIFNILGQLVVFLVSIYKFGRIKLTFRREIAVSVLRVSIMYMFSWLLTTGLNYADVYIVSGMQSPYEVGIFSGYQVNVRNYFSVFFHDIFAAVMLPTLINHGVDKDKLIKIVLKFLPVVFAVLAGGTGVVILLLLFAFGNQYPVIWEYIFIESAGIAFQGIYYFFNSLLVTEGKAGARASLEILAKPFLFLIAIIVVCTKLFGLMGTFVAFTVNQAVLAVVIVLCYRRRFLPKPEKSAN